MTALVMLTIFADTPAVSEIVERAVAVMDKKPAHMVCRLDTDIESFDGKGKPEDHVLVQIEETRRGAQVDHKILHVWKNGKDETADATAKEEKQKRKREAKKKEEGEGEGDQELLLPFTKEAAAQYKFELVREETLWGHRTFVLKVTARQRKPNAGDGTAWIDAESFVMMKGVFVPAKLPDEHVDWLRFQTQYAVHTSGFVLPTLFKVEGAGHFLLMKKGFRSTLRWTDCK
ncbi:MAG TPA: hypothetical protein VKN99_19145 [Polyangia bacterium]|nr:hypothetical protein [Polyangia bacterium]